MRAPVAALFILAGVGVAHADSPYAMLTKPKASWTYDVLDARKHKPTGAKLTATVSAVHAAGAYTVIEWSTSVTPADATDYQLPPMVLGPEGLRSLLGVPSIAPSGTPDYSEAAVAAAYKNSYLPTVYLPGTLKKSSKRLKLDRFGEDDRDYRLTLTVSKPDKHTWRAAWKGKYEVPESGEVSKYTASTDFDPDRGLVQLCVEDGACFKLAAP